MEDRNFRYYRFGEYCLDSRRRVLYKSDNRIDISAKNLDLLYVLVTNDGRVMTHDELLDAVWSGTFVEQSNLKKGISALRQILEESAGESLYIRTVPRQGYAFVAPVTVLPDESRNDAPFVRASQTEIYIEEVEEIIDEAPAAALTLPPPASRGKLWPVVAVAVLAIFSAFVAWRFVAAGPAAKRFVNVRVDKISSDGDCSGKVSNDANFVACILVNEAGDSAIEIRQIATDGRRRLIALPKTSIYALDFSPDGNFVYFVQKNMLDEARSGIYKISVLGGDAKFLVPNAGSMSLGADGRMLFTRAGLEGVTEILMADAGGGDERVVESFASNFRVWDFEFSPGQKAVTVAIRRQVSDVKNVFSVIDAPLDGGSQHTIVPERETLIASAAWAADAKTLFLCVREKNADIKQVWQYFPDSGEMNRLTNDNTSYGGIKVLKDGKTISATAENIYTNLFIADAGDYDFRQATSGAQEINGAFWLRDGRIGYSAVENSSELIRIVSEDGTSRERVTEGKDGYWIQPSLAGDGQTIAFNSNRAGLDQLWRIGIDGRNVAQVTRSETPIFNGRLLSDGTAIYKTYTPGRGWALIEQSPPGTIEKLPISDTTVWAISPDERRIASVRDGPSAGECEVLIHDRRNILAKPVNLSPFCGVDRLTWDRDSQGFTFAATSEGASELYRVSVGGGDLRKISNFRRDRVYSVDWSVDGQKIAVVRGKSFLDPVLLHTGY